MRYFLLVSMLSLFTAHALAEQKSMADSVELEKAWARATFKMAHAGAAYMTLTNKGSDDVMLVSASVDESVASMVELHETKMSNGMMQMQEIQDGVIIAANDSLNFEPGGMHFMIMGLTGPLEADNSFSMTIRFSDNSEKTFDMPIQDMRKRNAGN